MRGRSPAAGGFRASTPSTSAFGRVHRGDREAPDGIVRSIDRPDLVDSQQLATPRARAVWVSARFVIELLTGDADRR